MPFTRIDLLRGKSDEFLQGMSESLNDALALLESPPEDRFQVITQHEPGGLVFDRGFRVEGGGRRSDDFVVFTVSVALHHDQDSAGAFYRRLVELLGERPGIRPEDVFIMLQESPLWYFSFSHGIPLELGADPDHGAEHPH